MSNWQKVDSSAIEAVKLEGGAMYIRYSSGREYVHAGVSQATFDHFLNADSQGQFFNKHIAKQHPGHGWHDNG